MAEQQKKTSSDKLIEMLGGDPAKDDLSKDVLTEALKELKEERAEEAKKKAKEQLAKAIDLHNQHDKARKEFEGKSNKFQKDLGKIINKLYAMVQGQAPPPDDDEEESDAGESSE